MTHHSEPTKSTETEIEPVERQREVQVLEDDIARKAEAGRHVEFVYSQKWMLVHRRPPLKTGDGYALDPVCGATVCDDSVWVGIDEDTPTDVATKRGFGDFCSECFETSCQLQRLAQAKPARDAAITALKDRLNAAEEL